jgi:starch-binding outer membrane protein SusE/F
MKKILFISSAILLAVTGCKKVTFDDEPKGEALGPLKLVAPATNAAVALNAAVPANTIEISWTAAAPGVSTKPTYAWVAALKTGNIDQPILSIPSNNNGADTKLTLTLAQVDAALASKGIAAGATVDLIWSVVADNKSVQVRSADIFGIKITRFGDGATPFFLLAPGFSTLAAPTVLNPGSNTEITKFKWTKSFPKTGGAAVSYKVLFAEKRLDANGVEIPTNWQTPLFSIATAAVDSLNLDSKRLSDSLVAKGFTSLPVPVQLKWTVVATSGTWNQQSDYVNELVIVREVKVFIVGSASPGGWDINQSTRMIEDPRFPGTYFSYIRLTGGNEIKFVNGQAWPPAPGAIDWGQDPALPAGNITDNNENNIAIPSTGVYRVTFDLANKKFYLQTAVANGIGGLGMIGNFQGWSQPATKMSYTGVNKAILLANMNNGDEFKFHDGNDWNNSTNQLHRWFALNASGKLLVDPGSGLDNLKWTGASGRMRAVFDGSDVLNLQYKMSPASEMRVVGDGMQGVPAWTPGSSPTMTYSGNGVWTATLTLVANKEIKFLGGNDWPNAANRHIDYEDASGGSTAVGTPRSISEGGGPNFKTPVTTGIYTITLNEYTQTVTIN